MTYEQDAYSQTEDWDWDEHPVNLNRVFSSAVRDGSVTIADATGGFHLTDPDDCARVMAKIRAINSPRSSTEAPLSKKFTKGESFFAKQKK